MIHRNIIFDRIESKNLFVNVQKNTIVSLLTSKHFKAEKN